MSAVKNEFHEEIELKAIWDDRHNDNEAFESFEYAQIESAFIARVLGTQVLEDYGTYQYLNNK